MQPILMMIEKWNEKTLLNEMSFLFKGASYGRLGKVSGDRRNKEQLEEEDGKFGFWNSKFDVHVFKFHPYVNLRFWF